LNEFSSVILLLIQRPADSPDSSLSQAPISLSAGGRNEPIGGVNESGRVLASHFAGGEVMSFLDIFVEFVLT